MVPLLILVLVSALSFSQEPLSVVPTRTFEQTLGEVQSYSNEYQSSQDRIESIKLDFDSRELALETRIEATAEKLLDKRETLAPFIRREANAYSVALIQPLATGTEISFTPTLDAFKANSINNPKVNNLGWEVALTQNLWQDFMGRSTTLRRTRESFQRQQQLAEAYAQQSLILYNFEVLYWDLALAQKEMDLRQKNYEMSRQIYSWVNDRMKKSAAERSDLLQAQALVTNRELMFLVAQDRVRQMRVQMERYLPQQNWNLYLEDLIRSRDYNSLVIRWPAGNLDHPYKLELLQLRGESGAVGITADEQRELFKPDLDFRVAYARNAIEPNLTDAREELFNREHKALTFGLVFRTGLNFGLRRKKTESVQLLNTAAAKRLKALEAEAMISWQDLELEIKNLKARIERASSLYETQVKKAKEERRRYSMGRTTAFQAITFEQESADAELTLWNLHASLRKAESKARLYAR